ncbi:hypothetical protein GLOIN_2v383112 [Rhizophagus irregularis DAOM 181602=DAOM 197198]|nr:hypothetical protein GLOIN_2v383112 [Rhizophagus irregularis DAOM 181602=DAOM 197198]
MYTEFLNLIFLENNFTKISIVQDFFLFLGHFKFSFFFFCKLGSDSFLFVGCFSFVASESSFFVGQTFWSSLSFFVGMLTFGDLDDCRYYMKGGSFNKEGIFIMYLYFVYFLFFI